ncbi:MAG: deoxyribonuclease IV [Candidatus Magasanikbacteria bacterium]|nr:deoxyribonuclease IV [Candidatus Magasanikbacteria bacterium]
MLFGAHVSIAGGIFNAPLNAAAIGCEVFQMFTRSPHGGLVKPITPEVAALFKTNMALCAQSECYIHAPYFINYASANNRIRYGSISVIRQELERGTLLGAKYVMVHLGSYKDLGAKEGFKQLVEGLDKTLNGYRGSTEFLIEITAGAGQIIGDTFEEIAKIIYHSKLKKYNIGVCYDTQHAFASGYDCRTPAQVEKTLRDFDKIIGLNKLKLVQCNDSKTEFGSHHDRHEHIGQGKIGLAGFKAILGNKDFQKINFVLETEHNKVREDLKILKTIRG